MVKRSVLRILLLALIALTSLNPAVAEILTIEQSIDTARKNSLRFKQEENKLDISRLQEKKSQAGFYPKMNGEFFITSKAEPLKHLDNFDQFNPYVMEIRQPLYYFGELSHTYRASKSRTQASAYNLLEKEFLLEKMVFQAYMDVLRYQKNLRIQKSAIREIKTQMLEVEKMVQEGKRGNEATLRWKVLLDGFENELTDVEQKLHDSQIVFNRLLERETNERTDLAPYGTEEFETDLTEFGELAQLYDVSQLNKFLFDYAMQFNPSIKKTEELVNEARYLVKAEQSSRYPKVDFVQEFRSKDAKSPYYVIGLKIKYAFIDAAEWQDVGIKKKMMENIELDREILLRDVKSLINSYYSKTRTSLRQTQIRLRQSEEAHEYLEKSIANYQQGKASDLDLADAYKQYYDSRLAEVSSLYNYYIDRQNLYNTMGYSYYQQTTTLEQFIQKEQKKTEDTSDSIIKHIAGEVLNQGGEIILAINENNLEKVRKILESDPGVLDKKNHDSWTPLHFASYNGNREIVLYLLSKGADKDARTNFGRTPLYLAATQGKTEVVKALVDHKADVNIVSGRTNWSPLMRASKKKYQDIVVMLINAGANLDAQSEAGWTALHNAAEEGYYDIVKLLLEKGANPNIKTRIGRTPLDLAEIEGHSKVARLIRSYMKDGKSK